ncbi:PAS domain-containing protein [Pseudomonas silvicola]|nr:PAS domain-containing protein [Pseudomonas silvicola]
MELDGQWTMLDGYPVSLLWLDDNGHVRYANAAWKQLMGDEPSHGALLEWVHQEDRAGWSAALQRLLEHPARPLRQRLRFTPGAGALHWLEVYLSRGTQGFHMAAHDVTAQKRHETGLQASQRSASTLLNGIPGLVYRGRNNRDWSMEFVSAGCLTLTGYPAELLTDSNDFNYGSLIHPDDTDYVWREVQAALARRQPYELWYRICCADGGLKNVCERGGGIYADTGEVLGIEGIIYERSCSCRPAG